MKIHKYIQIITISALIVVLSTVPAVSIPAKFDGFVYKNYGQSKDNIIMIEAFFDPVCPDSRDAWPPLKKALQHYGSRLSLIVHPFPLPYHDNAYATSRALHIVNNLNASVTYTMLELFFEHQETFYNDPTRKMSREAVVDRIVNLAAEAVGSSSLSAVQSGFSDRQTDLTTRVSFKYGCSRGVYGTPFFFVNGFLLPDGGSAIDYKGWRSIIDPLDGAMVVSKIPGTQDAGVGKQAFGTWGSGVLLIRKETRVHLNQRAH
ncbi:Thioredoxin superfamily protein [Thalictrum thalictroides]|uniref:Thioredoxin superfamily protein n=1 Tax=Thalictrum thalictroides TaxID=46969 RepID=A0A7J6W0R0_THATH|nr:Thioredoxin superfamily protein [Thalictrum thalictroides]